MSHDGPRFYDDARVFQNYATLRSQPQSPNDTLERPVIDQLLGDVRGRHMLDLGCGDARFGRDLLNVGAASYLGVDGSQNMVAQAEQSLRGTAGRVVRSSLEDWDYPAERFDRATARLVLHYVADLEPLLRLVHRSLRPGGLLVFSVEHPVITSFDQAWVDGVRADWTVDRYFETGRRVTDWMGAEVVKFHRTIEDHFAAVQAAGFHVERLRESEPVRSNFEDEATYQQRRRVPLFLFVAARKAGGADLVPAAAPAR